MLDKRGAGGEGRGAGGKLFERGGAGRCAGGELKPEWVHVGS